MLQLRSHLLQQFQTLALCFADAIGRKTMGRSVQSVVDLSELLSSTNAVLHPRNEVHLEHRL